MAYLHCMKKLLFAICAGALLWAGCKEHDIPIDFSIKAISDTTYVLTSVPPAAPHQVLVEEFTGQTCPNCPQAHADLDAISLAHSGFVNVISLYTYGNPQSKPPAVHIYDFEDTTATNLLTTIYANVGGLPAAGIDRVAESGSIVQVGNSSWDGYITTQLGVADPLNLTVTSTYDSSKTTATITATVTYTQAQSTPQNLSIVVVEDSMYDNQEFPSGGDQLFWFKDVFRGMVTAIAGDVLQVTAGNDVKEAGRFFQKVYSYGLPAKTPALKPAHCRVIAFVNSSAGADKHIFQSAQCPLIKP